MAYRYDIQLNDDNDAVFSTDGDFVLALSDQQHIKDTVNAWPGWWKEYPLDGVGVLRYLNSSGQQQLLARKIKIELSSDGYQVATPEIGYTEDGTLKINPNATRL